MAWFIVVAGECDVVYIGDLCRSMTGITIKLMKSLVPKPPPSHRKEVTFIERDIYNNGGWNTLLE